ncbi:MAG: DNA gyrase modulator, partial [Dehalococcoidales bacterium]|nr:DNA gyrase modulator [Dehalococcoidales bacterium]
MENILAQAKNIAEEAEVFMVSTEETPVQFEANHLKSIQSKQSTTVTLRVIIEDKIGTATVTGLDDSQNLVNMAAEAAQLGMKAHFEFPSQVSYPQIEIFDSSVETVAPEAMISLGEELIATIRNHTPDILCHVGVSKGVISVRIINSRGGQVNYNKTVFSLGVWGNLIRGTDMLFVSESQSSCHPIVESHTVADIVLQQLE